MDTVDDLRRVTSGYLSAPDDVRALRKREWAVLGLLLCIALTAYFNLKRIVVDGVSMQPTFRNHQSVFVWTSAPLSAIKPGDVIVFRSPDGDEFIKRIIFIQNSRGTAQPPEYVWTPDGSEPFVMLFEDFYKNGKHVANDPPVDDRRIWVMGDNYDHSEDSRDFGPIAPKSILGKVIM